MNLGGISGGIGAELHGVNLNAHYCSNIGRQQGMGDYCKTGICEILHHYGHVMASCPAEGEHGTGQSFAGFQSNAVPAKLISQFHEAPIMGAFIHQEQASAADFMNINLVFLQLIGEGLLNIEDAAEYLRLLGLELIQHIADISGLFNGAVKVGGKIFNTHLQGYASNADYSVIVPIKIVAGKLNFQIEKSVSDYPISKQYGIFIVGLCAVEVFGIEGVLASDKVAGGYIIQLLPGAEDDVISKVEQGIMKVGPVSGLLDSGDTAEELLRQVLSEFEIDGLERSPVEYRCYCSRERVSRALISMGKAELEDMIEEQGSAELTCQFCDAIYKFDKKDLENLLTSALG